MDLFYKLIQVAVGSRHSLSRRPTDDEWKCVLRTALKQAVLGVCFVGIENLPEDQRPDGAILYDWIAYAERIRSKNEVMNARCVEVLRILKESGFRGTILKGQGIAQSYDEQLRLYRQSGDIDVWADGSKKELVAWVQSLAPTDEISSHHVQLHIFDDAEVEVHYGLGRLINLFRNPFFRRWGAGERSLQMANSVAVSGLGDLFTPTPDFNAVFLLTHMHRHFFYVGLGIRQMMDYFFLLKNHDFDAEDRSRIVSTVKSLGMTDFASAVMWVLGDLFCLPREKMLWPPDGRLGRFVLDEIERGGNFGQYDDKYKPQDGASHFMRYLQYVWNGFRFFRYFPAITILRPISYFISYFQIKIHKIFIEHS